MTILIICGVLVGALLIVGYIVAWFGEQHRKYADDAYREDR